MKEVLNFFIGQAGVQLGNALWELLGTEHGINQYGQLRETTQAIECLETFYAYSVGDQFVPRAIYVDLEPTVIDEVRTGAYKDLFHPDRLITGPEDAASNFARGFFTVGKLLLGGVNNETRKLLESHECTQGILLFRSLGGGTGAGLTSAIFDGLAEYPKITKIEIPIYPSPTLATAMVEPYNCLLGEHFCMEDIDVGLLLDNEALYDICSRYLTVSLPTFCIINRLVAQLISSITASVRFENLLNNDITVLQTNLVPYPRIHFPLANFAPVLSSDKAEHEELSILDLTRYVFDKENQMMKVDHSFGRFMSCSLLFRGNISPYDVYQALIEIKRDKSIEFVDWCPTGFKVGINMCPPTIIPASHLSFTTKNVTMLTNTSAIGQAWQRLTHKFYLLYSKRSFVHWFVGEGMEECEFTESLYNISSLVKDYEEAAKDSKFNDDENAPEANENASAQEEGIIKVETISSKESECHDTKNNNVDHNNGYEELNYKEIEEIKFNDVYSDVELNNSIIVEKIEVDQNNYKSLDEESHDKYKEKKESEHFKNYEINDFFGINNSSNISNSVNSTSIGSSWQQNSKSFQSQ